MTKKESWQPAPSDRVCSIHFVDGLATDENLIPTLFLSYESKEKKSSRTLFIKPLKKNVREVGIKPATSTSQEEEVSQQAHFIDENLDINMVERNEPMEVIHEPVKIVPRDHSYCLPNNSSPCYDCQDKCNLVKALEKLNKLTLENKQLKHKSIMETSTFTWRKIKTNAKIKYFTGINTIAFFNKIFRIIQPFLSDIIYWKRPKHAKNFSKVRHRRCNTLKKLSQRDQFLLTLMRLILGLLNEDLAERFGVS